jgi:class 3 adenylate cyclase/predicted ATPase
MLAMIYVFGEYELDTYCYELRRAGEPLQIEPKAFDLLVYLIRQHGRAISKDELLEHVWPGQFVSDGALDYCVMVARKAVGDSGRTQRVIKTVRGRGYRFIAPVAERLRETSMESAPGRLGHVEKPPPDQSGAMPASTSGQAARPFVPRSMDDAPAAAEHSVSDAERRQLTVMLCRVVASPLLSEQLDPEDLREVVQDTQEVCTGVICRFEGHIAQYLGDGLVVYFGYPQAREDDAIRAVHTGLGIVEEIQKMREGLRREKGVRLSVCVGIHTGEVVVGAMGQGVKRARLALGDTPNLAAQLQGFTKPDMVVVSRATLQLIEGYFVCRPLGSFLLEELSQTLAVYQVLRETGARSRLEVAVAKGLTPLVGRVQELGLLLERWEQVKEGMGQVVLLSGEVGIGKSRLVQVLKERIAGDVQARFESRCSPYYQNSTLHPVIEHLQQLLRFRREDTPQEKLRKLEEALEPYGLAFEEVVPLFASLLSIPLAERYLPLTMTPQRQKQKTLEALLAWLLKVAEQQPVHFIMEDLHWVDPSTLEFLSLLIDQIPSVRILMLLTFRPDFHPPWAIRSHLTHLTLGRLPRKQVEVMIEQVAGGKALPPELVQQLVAKTDGVPLFVEELTRMVVESGLIKERGGQYELTGPLPPLAIPATLQDSLMARLDRLGPAKQVAQLGATLGREFPYELVRAVAPVDEATLQRGLTQLVDAELLHQKGLPPQASYFFRHALIQETAYASLLRRARQQYHKRIVRVLEERFPETCETQPELLALHFTGAGLWREAVVYWQKAGQRASERSAHVEAISHLTKGLEALEMLPAAPERIQQELMLRIGLGNALIATRGYAAPEVGHVFGRARGLCQRGENIPQLFPVRVGLWNFYLVRAEFQTARALAEQCLRLAQRVRDSALALEAHFMLGVTLFFLGEFLTSWSHLKQCTDLYDPRRHKAFHTVGHPVVACSSYMALVLWLLGYPERARQKSEEALALAQASTHPFSMAYALNFAGWLRQLLLEGQTTQEMAEVARTLAAEQGFPFWEAQGTILLGRALFQQAQGEEGIACMRRGLSAYQATGAELLRPTFLALLVEAYEKGGRIDEGLDTLTKALELVNRHQERLWEAELHRLRGDLLQSLSGERQAEAEACFRQALEIARRQQAKSLELRAVMSLGRLWQRRGEQNAAHRLLAEVYGWFTEGFDTADLRAAKTLLEELGGESRRADRR